MIRKFAVVLAGSLRMPTLIRCLYHTAELPCHQITWKLYLQHPFGLNDSRGCVPVSLRLFSSRDEKEYSLAFPVIPVLAPHSYYFHSRLVFTPFDAAREAVFIGADLFRQRH
jgi:hypothetical protein